MTVFETITTPNLKENNWDNIFTKKAYGITEYFTDFIKGNTDCYKNGQVVKNMIYSNEGFYGSQWYTCICINVLFLALLILLLVFYFYRR